MKEQYEIRRLSLDDQRGRMQQQLDTFREELTAKLNIANREVQKYTHTHTHTSTASLTIVKGFAIIGVSKGQV